MRSFALDRAVELVNGVRAPEPVIALTQLLQRLVRRIGWAESAVHLELGPGRFEGLGILVSRSGGELTVDLIVPRDVAAAELAERLEERLCARGLALRAVRLRSG